MSKIFASLSFLLILTACEKSVNSGYNPIYSKYPTDINREWEYNTTIKLEFYDLDGRIDSTEFQDWGNTVCLITYLNDTLGDFSNLILFQEFDLATPQNVHRMWYLNADSGLYAIAYQNPGSSQVILPKLIINSTDELKRIIKLTGLSPASYEGGKILNQISDSIQFYNFPRKVLKYPIRVGERWVELIEPFYRERFINTKERLTINGVVYNCFKIESDWDHGITFNDFINFTSG